MDKEIFHENLLFGHHETQVAQAGEADLQTQWNDCRKNPGHAQFIPITRFGVTDLPEGYRDIDLRDVVKVTADLTVRIAVTMVSSERPDFWPNTPYDYPFHEMKGSKILRTGSGEISVYKFIDGCGYDGRGSSYNAVSRRQRETDFKTCPCKKCQHSEKPNKVWWVIFVLTAAHVVFDDIEARHTTCRLFYDEADSAVINIYDIRVDYVNVERDYCQLKCVTCDERLGGLLFTKVERWIDLWRKVWNKYTKRLNDKFMFIVSHPHGCFKQVSIGTWIDNNKVSNVNKTWDLTKLTYETCTCPGSSGAILHCIGFGVTHVHSGTIESKLNFSSIGLY